MLDLLAAECEQAARESSRPFPRDKDFGERGLSRVIRFEQLLQNAAISQDHSEKIVEVVRNPACEPPDRLHFPGLFQLLNQLTLLGDLLHIENNSVIGGIGVNLEPRV